MAARDTWGVMIPARGVLRRAPGHSKYASFLTHRTLRRAGMRLCLTPLLSRRVGRDSSVGHPLRLLGAATAPHDCRSNACNDVCRSAAWPHMARAVSEALVPRMACPHRDVHTFRRCTTRREKLHDKDHKDAVMFLIPHDALRRVSSHVTRHAPPCGEHGQRSSTLEAGST